jgi:hypothetical protein
MSWWDSKAMERVKLGATSAQIAWAALGPTGTAALQRMDVQPPMNGAQYSQMVQDDQRKDYEEVYKQGVERDNERMTADPRGEMNRISQEKLLRERPRQAGESRSNPSHDLTKKAPARDVGKTPQRRSSTQATRSSNTSERAKTSPNLDRSPGRY